MKLTHLFRGATALALFLCVMLTLYVLNVYVDSAVRTILSPGQYEEVVVERGIQVRRFASQLEDRGLVSAATHFTVAYISQYPSSSMQAGLYEINDTDTLLTLVNKIARGASLLEKITIIEGWQWKQVKQSLHAHQQFTISKDQQILEEINRDFKYTLRGGKALISLEGLLMPDTYKFKRGISDRSIVKTAVSQQVNTLMHEWESRDKTTNYATPYQALIVASLIERESGFPAEYSKIAAVILNRIRVNMPLQIDASVIYGMGRHQARLKHSDLKRDSAYNTYTRRGLPPTPIGMPSHAAIHAALHPFKFGALYYVLDGAHPYRHIFTTSFADHRAQKQVQKQRSKVHTNR